MREVSLSYGAEEVLHDIDLEVRPGEVVALVGPSGAGKSTLLSLANASFLPDAGTVALLGEDSTTLRSRSARRRVRARVGTVQQSPQLPGSLQVVHNVNAGRIGSWSFGRSLWSLVHPLGVDEVQAALDDLGIGHLTRARTDTLSGGQQQRVAMARVLVQRPALMLADEPVSAVDPAWSRRVLELLLRLAGEGAGVLVAIHDIDLALESVTRVVGLRDGRIRFDLPPTEVDAARLADLYDLLDR